MKMFHLGQEPNLCVKIHLADSTILKTTLSIDNPETGFFCSFVNSSDENQEIEEKILTWMESYGKKLPPPKIADLQVEFALYNFPSDSFKWKVLTALEGIPFGSTATYKEIALVVGQPNAARAVGNICRDNSFPLFIPCHRVIQSDGRLGGFAFGLETKTRLLNFERTN